MKRVLLADSLQQTPKKLAEKLLKLGYTPIIANTNPKLNTLRKITIKEAFSQEFDIIITHIFLENHSARSLIISHPNTPVIVYCENREFRRRLNDLKHWLTLKGLSNEEIEQYIRRFDPLIQKSQEAIALEREGYKNVIKVIGPQTPILKIIEPLLEKAKKWRHNTF